MAYAESIPSRGHWAAEVTRGRMTVIQPKAFMRLSRVALPLLVREVEGAVGTASSAAWKCRLALWEGVPGDAEPTDGAMVATLVPYKTENASTDILLFPGHVYTFEVIGGGAAVHISGRFEQPIDGAVGDTEIRVITGRASRMVLRQNERDVTIKKEYVEPSLGIP
ncbi:hypothetical protein NMY22_g17970 [Coprinellus aureogranulatus]|nr:hypothetical protein NMY22_g17970 [Coprinellus aureogranulatus]